MSYYLKYLKYKNKYLVLKNQSAGNPYASLKFYVNTDDYMTRMSESSEIQNLGDDFKKAQIMEVIWKNKTCSSFSISLLRESIQKYSQDLYKIIETCLVYDNNLFRPLTDIDMSNNVSNATRLVLYFADKGSLDLYLTLISNNSKIIFPDSISVNNLYDSFNSISSPSIIRESSYNFHILHGILFSYDIKDIYGYLKSLKQISTNLILKLQQLYNATNQEYTMNDNTNKIRDKLDNISNQLDVAKAQQIIEPINRQTFFILLHNIINIILSYDNIKEYKKSILYKYATIINFVNILGTHDYAKSDIKNIQLAENIIPNNFRTIRYNYLTEGIVEEEEPSG